MEENQELEVKMKKCSKCDREFPANNTYYFSNSKLKDGLEGKCKECKGYVFQDYKNKNKSEIEGHKKCSTCKEDYPLNSDYFNSSKTSNDKYSNVCKQCQGYKFTHYNCKEGYQVCIKCLKELELNNTNYYKDKGSKLGYKTVCIDCATGSNIDNFDINIWYEKQGNIFKNNWILDDIVWLYNNYVITLKQDLIKRFPNKKYKTLTTLIGKWNLRKFNKKDNWNDEDIEFLKENYPSMIQVELENHFKGRTWHSIKTKASKLSICRNEEMLFKINSDAHKGYIHKEESKLKMSRNRRGINNYNWKGGLTPLHTYFRGILYEWKMDSLKPYNYKCAFTGENNGDLQIHHANENFSDIIVETLNLLGLPIHNDMLKYSDEEIVIINKCFLELNYKHGLGIPLAKPIHKLFHVLYGLTNNTEEQFEEFKQRYMDGEFKEALKLKEEKIKTKPRNKKKQKRLKAEDVVKIRELLSKGFPITYISKEFGTKDAAIYNIKINKSWKNIV